MSWVRESIMIALDRDRENISAILKMIGLDGGAGSGNFGHSGRPGQVGGSAKRVGGGNVSKERTKEIKQERANFKKLTKQEKIDYLKDVGQFPVSSSKFDERLIADYAYKHHMSEDKYLDWRAARYFTIKKFQPEIEYKTPLKSKEVQTDYKPTPKSKLEYIKEHTGCSDEVCTKMYSGLMSHFGHGDAPCEWTDKFIDSDGRYEGAIYRWKRYSGDKAKQIVAGLVPGAKIGNEHESNWSFSSDPWATKRFGGYDDTFDGLGEVSIRYTCEKNITASPVQCLSGFSLAEQEVIPHSKTTWTITDVEKIETPYGHTMYDVHMVEDDWHEERGIPVWKPTGNEIAGGWTEDFPKDDGEADTIFQNLKSECKKNNSDEEIKLFMSVCPDGTTFYQLSDDRLMVVRKINDGSWEYADVTQKYNDHIDEWKKKMEESDDVVEFGNEWSHYDKDIWKRCEEEGLTNAIVERKAKEMLLDDDMFLIEVGNTKNIDFEKANEVFKKMKDEEYFGDPKEFFDSFPQGTQIYDKHNGITFQKNDEGEWDYLDPEDGSKVTTYGTEDMVTISDGNPYYELVMKKENESAVNKPYEAPIQKWAKWKSHETYNGVQDALNDFNETKDESECVEWLKDCPKGTVFVVHGEDEEKYGGKLVSEGNGKWGFWEKDEKTDLVDDEFVAKCVTSKFYSLDVKSLPVKIPDNVSDAEAVLKGIKEHNHEQVKEFVEEVPVGTMAMNSDTGFVWKKVSPIKWEGFYYEDTDFSPEKDWNDYSDKDVFNTHGDAIAHNIGVEGTHLISLGEKKTAHDGGEGSGNHNHAGRPGHVGGSAPSKEGSVETSEGEKKEEEPVKEKTPKKKINKAKPSEVKKFYQKQKSEYEKMDNKQKNHFARENGIMPKKLREYDEWCKEANAKGLGVWEYRDYCVAQYFAVKENSPHYGTLEYKTPLKKVKAQEDYIKNSEVKLKMIQDENGVDKQMARRMLAGLSAHFDDGTTVDPWIDRYVDSDGRYEGAIYRWKSYSDAEAQEKLRNLYPGARIGNEHGSNWSFSSSPTATEGFGLVKSSKHDSFCYICEDNKTASPVECFSGFGNDEKEVIPHSQATWTVQRVESIPKGNGRMIHKVYMTEDDWHEEKGIPVWKPEDYVPEVKTGGGFKDFGEAKDSFTDSKMDEKSMEEFLNNALHGTQFVYSEKGWVFTKNEDDTWNVETPNSESTAHPDEALEYAMEDTSYLWNYPIVSGENDVSVKTPPKNYNEVEKALSESTNNEDYDETSEILLSMKPGTKLYDEDDDTTYEKLSNGQWDWKKKQGEYEIGIQYTNDDMASFMVDKQSFEVAFLPLDINGTIFADEIFDQVKDNSVQFKNFIDSMPNESELMTFGVNPIAFQKRDDGWYYVDMDENNINPHNVNPVLFWEIYGDKGKKVPDMSSDIYKTMKSGMCTNYGNRKEKKT